MCVSWNFRFYRADLQQYHKKIFYYAKYDVNLLMLMYMKRGLKSTTSKKLKKTNITAYFNVGLFESANI